MYNPLPMPGFRYQPMIAVSVTAHVDEHSQHRPALVQSADGRRWWAKSEDSMGWQGVYCETLAAVLGKKIDAALPTGATSDIPNLGRCWLSADLGLVLPWEESQPLSFSNGDALGAAIALDALLFNEDRHGRNVLWSESGGDALLWFIDWEGSRLGFHPAQLAGDLVLQILNSLRVPTGSHLAA